MTEEIQWWGYIHTSGTLHAKRYFDMQDIEEAKDSPFVKHIFHPMVGTRDDLIKIMEAHK